MTENAELRAQLAVVQDQCVELAVDAGELHAENEAMRRELAEFTTEMPDRGIGGIFQQREVGRDDAGLAETPCLADLGSSDRS